MKKLFLSLIVLFSVTASFAEMDHSDWDALLKKYVTSAGKVNYKGFRTDKTKLEAYLTKLETNVPGSSESSNAKKAYWCNAYNAYTVKLIVDNYPVRSINDIKLGGATPWARKWIKIGSETLSLNDIENTKLRKVYKDARIHFVINCASFSCPILVNKALTSANIEATLAAQTKSFINDSARNQITAKSLKISNIFDWYKEDFGDIITFINKYSKVKVAAGTKIEYLPYSWDLNE